MIYLLVAVGVGVVRLLPRLRAQMADTPPQARWDHFLVASGLRPVPVTMAEVVAVATRADIPAAMLDRVALGRGQDRALVMVAQLTNGKVLVAARRDGPTYGTPGVTVVDGWQLQVVDGPPDRAWSTTPLRSVPALR